MIDIKVYNAEQIGGCFTVITTSKAKIMIDYGQPLPGAKAHQEDFDWEHDTVDAVFITHYHSDHVGRILDIPDSIPIYMGKTTRQIMINIHETLINVPELQEEQERWSELLSSNRIEEIQENKVITAIKGLAVTPYSVDHSAYDAYMYLIEADGKVILHTGDFRGHGYRGAKMIKVIQNYIHENGRKVDYLITEGTMMGKRKNEKVKRESELYQEAKALFKEHKHVFLIISSTNLDSLTSFYHAAKENRMNMYCYNYYFYKQLQTFSNIAGEKSPWYQFKGVYTVDFEKQLSHELWDEDKSQEEFMREYGFLCVIKPEEKYHAWIKRFEDKNPLVIYSMWDGYIDAKKGKDAYNENWAQFFAPYKASQQYKDMHTSGHATAKMIEEVIKAVDPQEAIIPMHTENAKGFKKLEIGEELKLRVDVDEGEDMQDFRTELLKDLKRVAPRRNIKLTADIEYRKEGDQIWLVMSKYAIGYGKSTNMQKDSDTFEGWATIIKAHYISDEIRKVVLDVDIDEMPSVEKVFSKGFKDKAIKTGHYGRFLYRALRFFEDYDWFELSPKVMNAVKEFENVLQFNICCNHLQDAEAGMNHHKEIRVEAAFSEYPDELIGLLRGTDKEIKGNVYRQLNCWLRVKGTKTALFTESKSAMDLWNLTDNEMNIFELKSDNCKIGIISEIFFYTHYCRDVFSKNAVFEMLKSEKNQRGYGELQDNSIEKINGFILADKSHPLITDRVLEILNENQSGIAYYITPPYNLEHMLSYSRKDNKTGKWYIVKKGE